MRWASRASLAGAAVSTVLAVTCVVRSSARLSMTTDEPNHLAAGLEWIQYGTYSMWTENPPLPRVAAAIAPYLAGARLPPPSSWDPQRSPGFVSFMLGAEVLYRGDAHARNLAQARATNVLFLVMAVVFTALIAARGRGGWPAAGIAAAAVATLPTMVAHASLATTDMAFVATFLFAVWAFDRWLDRPSAGRGALLGFALAAALASKFTVLVFFPAAAIGFVGARLLGDRVPGAGRRARLASLALAVGVALFASWASYRFSFGKVTDPRFITSYSGESLLPPEGECSALERLVTRWPLPAPELFHGLLHLRAHNRAGHPAYLAGQLSQHGFLAFYPIALFFKAPLSAWVLIAVGLALLIARRRDGLREVAPAIAAIGILLVLTTSSLNLGVRHALVVYPLLLVAAGNGVVMLLDRLAGARRLAVALVCGGLLLAQEGVLVAARPDFLSYFNPLAGDEPGRLLLDSDLDWNQGFRVLAEEARRRGIPALKIAARITSAKLCEEGLPPLTGLVPHQPTTGWIAIAENLYWGRTEDRTLRDPCRFVTWGAEARQFPPGWFLWLHQHRPVWRGGGLRLYHIGD
jgi:4-amino-4-deoxy-L-arabinose transferase-like glycosyltransferase